MSVFMEKSWVTLLALGSIAWSDPSFAEESAESKPIVSVNFLDDCSDKVVAVSDPEDDDLRLSVLVEGMVPWRQVDLKVRLYPVGNDTYPAKLAIRYRAQMKANRNGDVKWEQDLDFPNRPALQSYGRVWRAEVSWSQGILPGDSGKIYNDIYLAESNEQSFFEIQRERICQWQGKFELKSTYLFNDKGANLEVTSSISTELHDTRRGLTFQATDQSSEQTQSSNRSPLLTSQSMASSGWYFPRWEGAYGNWAQFKGRLRWVLEMQQGGFFAERKSYSRFETTEYRRKKVNGCYQWRSLRSGVLDVATKDLQFFPMTREYASDTQEALEFIDSIQPPENTCTEVEPRQGLEKFRIPLSQTLPMYFYPN